MSQSVASIKFYNISEVTHCLWAL